MLRLRHLRLRAQTVDGLFGVDIPFEVGLNVLRADNTTGKSTCLQGLLYVLGLERMLSPRRDIPLTYVMTSHLDDPSTGKRHQVVESSVLLELENGTGEIITVRRAVANPVPKLVSVFSGPLLSEPGANYRQRDYFVRDPGAAQREAGFHHFLASFIGWILPTVRRYDGTETQLYLETIFPLLYVEQKAGWSAIPAAFPTYFQIREVGQRAVEFLLALDTHGLELKKQELELELAASGAVWDARRDGLLAIAALVHGRVEGLPERPAPTGTDLERAFIAVTDGTRWRALDEELSLIRARAQELAEAESPVVNDVASEAATAIEQLTATMANLHATRNALFRARQTELTQKSATERRLSALQEDLRKNMDAQKLRSLGSTVTEILVAEACPTCSQPIADALLSHQVRAALMPLEDNIDYIKAQTGIFQKLLNQSDAALEDLGVRLGATTAEVNAIGARLRALANDLVAPSDRPSVAAIEERVRLEARLEALGDTLQRFEVQKAALLDAAAGHADLLARRASLPTGRLSEDDRSRIGRLATLVRDQATEYGFSTFAASDLEISEESFRPQKEGFEIGFELSASDAIRLKWAFQIALLEVGRTEPTHHPGFVIFDEPRQQETAKISFKRLLQRAANAGRAGQQVIFATSEDRDELEEFLTGLDCHLVVFEGRIVKRLA